MDFPFQGNSNLADLFLSGAMIASEFFKLSVNFENKILGGGGGGGIKFLY